MPPTPSATVITPQPGQLGTVAATLADQVSALGGGHVVFDLAAIPFAGSQDLGALVALNRKVKAAGGRLSMVNVRPLVFEVFAVTRLTALLDVSPAATAA